MVDTLQRSAFSARVITTRTGLRRTTCKRDNNDTRNRRLDETLKQFSKQGGCAYHGEGGEPDFEYAARMFRESSENGHGQAQNQLGLMYINGDGMTWDEDDTQAVAWFGKSADNDISHGQANLAGCYLNGWGVERDVFEAGQLFRLTALQGQVDAQWKLRRSSPRSFSPKVERRARLASSTDRWRRASS
jgi:hypothetical protein